MAKSKPKRARAPSPAPEPITEEETVAATAPTPVADQALTGDAYPDLPESLDRRGEAVKATPTEPTPTSAPAEAPTNSEPDTPAASPPRQLNYDDLRERGHGVSCTVDRRVKQKGFPEPHKRGRENVWDESAVVAWEAANPDFNVIDGTAPPNEEPDAGDAEAQSIGELYAQGRAADEQARAPLAEALECYHECGARLNIKKALLGHGRFGSWLKANAAVLGFDDNRTAQRLMAYAKSNPAPAPDMATDEALALSRQLWGHKPRPPARKKQERGDGVRDDDARWFRQLVDRANTAVRLVKELLKDAESTRSELTPERRQRLRDIIEPDLVPQLKQGAWALGVIASYYDKLLAESEDDTAVTESPALSDQDGTDSTEEDQESDELLAAAATNPTKH